MKLFIKCKVVSQHHTIQERKKEVTTKTLVFSTLLSFGLFALAQGQSQSDDMYAHRLDGVYGSEKGPMVLAQVATPQDETGLSSASLPRQTGSMEAPARIRLKVDGKMDNLDGVRSNDLKVKTETAVSATAGDIRKAVSDISKVISESERDSVARQESVVKQSTEKSVSAVKSVGEDIRRGLESNALNAELAEASRHKSMMRFFWISLVSLIVVIIGSVFALTLFFQKRERVLYADAFPEILTTPSTVTPSSASTPLFSEPASTPVSLPTESLRTDSRPLVDPDIPALGQWSRLHGEAVEVPFVLTLPSQGAQFNCKAVLRPGLLPLVYIADEKDPVSWEKRRQKARQIFDRQTLSVSVSA